MSAAHSGRTKRRCGWTCRLLEPGGITTRTHYRRLPHARAAFFKMVALLDEPFRSSNLSGQILNRRPSLYAEPGSSTNFAHLTLNSARRHGRLAGDPRPEWKLS